MKKDTPSRLAPSRLASSKRAPSKRAPSRLAPSTRAPARRLPVLAMVLVLAAILAAVSGTLAVYTSQAFWRGVVRNQDTTAIFFSSDKLYSVSSGTPAQVYYYPMSSKEQNTMTFQVCNYDQNQNTSFRDQDLSYTINFQVTKGTDGFGYTISNGSDSQTFQNGESVSFTDHLTGRNRSANSYKFTFKGLEPENTEADYNKVELLVTVTPDDLNATRQTILNGVLIPIAYASTQGVTIKYEFTDSTRRFDGNWATPDQFDAYNLSVSISGGAGDVLITWDHTQLDIDPFFTQKVEVTPQDVTSKPGWSSVTVPMDAAKENGVYLIQFYNRNPEKPDWKAWSELPISVELTEQASP